MNALKKQMQWLASQSKKASRSLAHLSKNDKKKILNDVAKGLEERSAAILKANRKDLETGRKMELNAAALDRLMLDERRIRQMAKAVHDVAALTDPVNQVLKSWKRPNGLNISKVTVPLGVILIIYESRPNVTSECASLCLKSGNAVILRGGREALHSNLAIVNVYRSVLKKYSLPMNAITLVPVTDRRAIDMLLQLENEINLVIPRGGERLIRRVAEQSKIPVVKHYKGICHIFIDRDANLDKAISIAINAKCQRTGVCNAMETLLVHKSIAKRLLPVLCRRYQTLHCELRGDERVRKIVPGILRATAADWSTEYLDNILSIRIVSNLSEAVAHIEQFGSGHTDAIVTENARTANQFVQSIDSSSVMVNASTRFSDGNEYGFGAEIGISTDKVHARGPMGLEGLVSYKYVVRGNGQIRT